MKRPNLRQVNNMLSVVVVGLCLYLILAPFWPKATFEFKQDPPILKGETIPAENTLVIPKMKLQTTIHENSTAAGLRQGVWRRPHSSTPPNGGNTVLTGHRFTYAGPAVLYHLDKVQPGDSINVFWNRKRYDYRVENVQVVPPTASEVEAQTSDPVLTIYTCTPLITATNRLVIQAKPLETP